MSSECTAIKREGDQKQKDRSMYGERPNRTIDSDHDSPIRVISVCSLQTIHIGEEDVAFADKTVSIDLMDSNGL